MSENTLQTIYNLEEPVSELFHSQLLEWDAAQKNYKELEQVKSKTIRFSNCIMDATFNPARIVSSAAKVDAKSIQERPCFLCGKNRPPVQKGINFLGRYEILINPFPIFKHHLTIPDTGHVDQLLSEQRITDMLTLAASLPAYSILYNGPKCGASAPDHFHFQAGDRNYMPVEKEAGEYTETIYRSDSLVIKTRNNYVRKILIVESDQQAIMAKGVMQILKKIGEVVPREPEPMVNLITFYENRQWKMCIFPRKEHRPSQFFEQGEKQIMFSPGTVDFGGTIIFPREEDYNKITPEAIENMFAQLTFSDAEFEHLMKNIQTMKSE